MIYGNALGAPAQSVQIPALGIRGRAVHRTRTESLVECTYRRCRGALCVSHRESAHRHIHVRREEEALAEISKAIAARLGLGAPQSWSAEQAIAAWGWNMAVFSLGSNSRVRGKAAADLGWSPTQRSVTRWIADELT